MLRTNRNRLVKMAVVGELSSPTVPRTTYRVGAGGKVFVPLGMAGVVYNVKVGDPAFGWEGDHVEPAVSIHHPDAWADHAMHYLVCVGNKARVITGDTLGTLGVVTGEHARFLIDFPDDVLDRLCIGDQIQIEAFGTGLELLDYPHITPRKLDPDLLDRLNIRESPGGVLQVGVTLILPAHTMASGWELGPEYVDQDIMSNDRDTVRALGIDRLRLGDLVAVVDTNHSWGRGYKKGGVFIGLVNHGDSNLIGHGPGCMTILSCPDERLQPFLDPEANIANYLACGRARC